MSTSTPKHAPTMGKSTSHNDAAFHKRWMRANELGCRWLADANEAEERGAVKTAAKCMAKAQYWLDRLNELDGLS